MTKILQNVATKQRSKLVNGTSKNNLQVPLNDWLSWWNRPKIERATLRNKSKALTSGQRLRMRKARSCKGEILEKRETCVDFLETRSKLFEKQVRWPHYFILKLGSVDLKNTIGKILKNSLDRIYSDLKITVFCKHIKSAPENFFLTLYNCSHFHVKLDKTKKNRGHRINFCAICVRSSMMALT